MISDNSESSFESESDNNNLLPLDPEKEFNNKELCYYKMIDKYYKQVCSENNIQKMIDIIEGKSDISLRILDWVVTKYSKGKIELLNADDQEEFDIHISYKSQLKSYKKKYFDPFRRRNKINYQYSNVDKSKIINTTIGQLNFFKWAITHNIIKYVEDNLQLIVKAMNVSNKEDKKKKLLENKSKGSKSSIVSNKSKNDNIDENSKNSSILQQQKKLNYDLLTDDDLVVKF
jgi:hypothetical protein